MKKTMMTLMILALATGALAETISVTVYSKKNGKYWGLRKVTSSGKNKPVANFDRSDTDFSIYDGKKVEVTGELNPNLKFPSFLPGAQIKVIGE